MTASKQKSRFAEMVLDAMAGFGPSAAEITTVVMCEAFPKTCAAADEEHATSMLRDGVYNSVRRIIKKNHDDIEQVHINDLHPNLMPYINELNNDRYYVVSTQQWVHVSKLIENRDLFQQAIQFMKLKGKECIEESVRLTDLYEKVFGEYSNATLE